MTTPGVNINELDGALGIQPAGGQPLRAIVGPCPSGPEATPSGHSKLTGLTAQFGSRGPAVELAARHVERGVRVVMVNTGSTTPGAVDDLDVSGVTGTSVVTLSAGDASDDDYEPRVRIVNGGTIGVLGITYQESLDDGRNWSAIKALGVATDLAIPNSGGISFDLAAGTLVAGDVWFARATAPAPNATQVTAAMTALRNTGQKFESIDIAFAVDATLFDALNTAVGGLVAQEKDIDVCAGTRVPDFGETESEYQTAMGTAFSAKSSKYISLWSGSCEVTSSITGNAYLRSAVFAGAATEALVKQHINTADVDLGALPGVTLTDAAGNPKHHDEAINPGLDDLRFATLRTVEGYNGVYVNRQLLFSSAGSDYEIKPHRKVMNLVKGAARRFLKKRLAKPIIVDRATGFILESEAKEIEAGVTAAVIAVVGQEPMVSAVLPFVISRTDNLLSTKTITGFGNVIPLAYPEQISFDVAYYNPALAVQAA